jgi:hypothetical protein
MNITLWLWAAINLSVVLVVVLAFKKTIRLNLVKVATFAQMIALLDFLFYIFVNCSSIFDPNGAVDLKLFFPMLLLVFLIFLAQLLKKQNANKT